MHRLTGRAAPRSHRCPWRSPRQGARNSSGTDGYGAIQVSDPTRVLDVGWRATPQRGTPDDASAGLGLAIAKGVVEAHARSTAVENVMGGCRFGVRLRRSRSAAASNADSAERAAPHAVGERDSSRPAEVILGALAGGGDVADVAWPELTGHQGRRAAAPLPGRRPSARSSRLPRPRLPPAAAARRRGPPLSQ